MIQTKKPCQTQYESDKVFHIKMCQKEPSPLAHNAPTERRPVTFETP